MKRCPTCSRVYDDVNLRFCLDDGTALVNKLDAAAGSPTLVLPLHDQVPTMKQDFRPEVAPVQQNAGLEVTRQRRILPWLLGAGTLLVLIGLGAAAVLAVRYFRPPLIWHLVVEVDSG